MQTEMMPARNSFRNSVTEHMVCEKVEHLCREVKKLELSLRDHRICTALQDAALMIRSRLSLIKKETGEAQRAYFENDDVNFSPDEYDRH